MFNIEFAGLPGSGKSTLYRLLTERLAEWSGHCHGMEEVLYLSLKERRRNTAPPLFSKHGPELNTRRNQPRNMTYLLHLKFIPEFFIRRNSQRIFRHSQDRFDAQNKFLATNSEVFNAFLESTNYCSMDPSERWLVLSWFMNFVSVYQFIEEHYRFDEGIVFQEGFIQKSMSLFVSPNISYAIDDSLMDYLNAVPIPRMLIWVNTNVDICFDRLLSRSKSKSRHLKGMRLRGLNPDSIKSFLISSGEHFNRVLQWAVDNKIPVVFADNNGLAETAAEEIFARIYDSINVPFDREIN